MLHPPMARLTSEYGGKALKAKMVNKAILYVCSELFQVSPFDAYS